ncbi:MAG: family 43 glycosylhydrolase [Marinilabiliaceae bacterium]|nr:family 43 glycosylhydrolase [Marinilabiliaceae bacterium]
MIRIALLLVLVITGALSVFAQNPIIKGTYNADPTARVFNGRVYLFPSHDIPPATPELQARKWFCMGDYHVYSSDDMVHWTDHGVILDQKDVPWGQPDAYSMWAPDCVTKDGKYYFYFPDAPKAKEGERPRGFGIGVAVADKPEGPYKPAEEPVKGAFGIDPCVLMDNDGSAYIFWSGMGQRVAKLKDNMCEVDGEAIAIDGGFPRGNGLKEGPFAFRRADKYYFTFPWVRDSTELLAYAMSDKPMGPYEFKGIIMDASATGCWTNHHSIVEFNGQWYLFYHHNDYSPDFDKNRSTRIDSLSFNADGTIRKVKATLRGVGISKANEQIQIDRYSYIEGPVVEYINRQEPFLGWYTDFKWQGDYVKYNAVDFAKGYKKVNIRYRANNAVVVLVRTAKGEKIAELNMPQADDWSEITLDASDSVKGVQDIVVELRADVKQPKGFGAKNDGSLKIDWLSFGN